MKEIKSFELLSLKEVRSVAGLDAPAQARVVDDKGKVIKDLSDQYIDSNHLTYYIICNTWLNLVKDYAPFGWSRLAERITTSGLIDTIRKAQDAADYLVHQGTEGFTDSFPYEAALLREIRVTGRPAGMMLYPEYNIGREPVATLLCLLRYPKRFSPSNNCAVQAASIDDFLDGEKRTKELQRSQGGRYSHDIGYSRYVLDLVRQFVHDMYDWDKICDRIEAIDTEDILFSTGAGYDSKSSLGSKFRAINKTHSDYWYRPFEAYVVPRVDVDGDEGPRLARISAVPKSFKASRIIAMEDTYRLAFCKYVENFFREQDNVLHNLCLTDQSINQQLAEEGSRTGKYATLDASHASDYISVSLFVELFPWRYVQLILPYLATHYEVNGKIYRKEMLSTSGHTLTFRHESIVYKAIGLAASHIGRLYRGENAEAFSWAYGDDTIVESQDAQLAMECFKACGLVINESKSFYSLEPGYRESCGEEYKLGLTMTSVYYPRFPVLGTVNPIKLGSDRVYNDSFRGKLDDSTTMLIDLQKKLFPISVSAARFVWCIVKEAHPKMTSSPYGSTCPDLWDIDDLGITRVPRSYHFVTVGYSRLLGDIGRIPKEFSKPHKGTFSFSHFGVTATRLRYRRELVCDGSVENDAVLRAARRDTYHYAPYVAYHLERDITKLDRDMYDMYRYREFLRRGPRFASPLDELLGVSQPDQPIAAIYGRRRMAWRLQLVDFTK